MAGTSKCPPGPDRPGLYYLVVCILNLQKWHLLNVDKSTTDTAFPTTPGPLKLNISRTLHIFSSCIRQLLCAGYFSFRKTENSHVAIQLTIISLGLFWKSDGHGCNSLNGEMLYRDANFYRLRYHLPAAFLCSKLVTVIHDAGCPCCWSLCLNLKPIGLFKYSI